MAESIGLRELTGRWLRESEGVMGPETLRQYGWYMEQYVLPRLGDSAAVTAGQADALRGELRAAGLSDSTLNAVLRVLRRVLEYGASAGLCEPPAWDAEAPTARKKYETVILSSSDEKKLCQYLTGHPDGKHLCLFLMLTAGLQIGEALGLKWEDISLKKGEMKVRSERGPMTGRKRTVRTVPLGERQKIYLRKLAGPGETYLCTGTGKPMGRANLQARFRNLLREQALPPMSPTCLRHTFAVRCIESGMDYVQLSQALGVDNTQTFRHFYRELVSPELKGRLEQERFLSRKARVPNKTRTPSPKDAGLAVLENKVEARKKELRDLLDSLEGDLAILQTLRNSDCVQGQAREGFYRFVETVLGPDDKDGQFLVQYLRCNMRVAAMPLRQVTTVQAIRRRVAHGFAKLTAKIAELEAAASS